MKTKLAIAQEQSISAATRCEGITEELNEKERILKEKKTF
jgi:hypothetical protein